MAKMVVKFSYVYVFHDFPWWGRMESNHLPSGYEPPALTDELRPRLRYYIAKLPLWESKKPLGRFARLLGQF